MIISSVTAQPEAHSHFMSGVRRCCSELKHSQWKSMEVTCSVMSDRSLLTSLAISHVSPNLWSIEFLYTWCMTPVADTHIFGTQFQLRHQGELLRTNTLKHTHTQTHLAKFDSRLKSEEVWINSIDAGWQTQEERRTHTDRHMRYVSTDSEWNSERREILTVATSPG